MVQRIAQKVHVTALPGRLDQHLADRLLQTGVVIRHDKLHAMQAALLQSQQKLPPTRCFPGWPD
jgi:hypothetical protein